MSWDIVGIGARACLGADPHAIFDALCRGESGAAPLRVFDPEHYRSPNAFEIDDRAEPGSDEVGRATRWLCAAVAAALEDAGLGGDGADYPVLVGTTLRELRSAELWWRDSAPLRPPDLHFSRALHERFGTVDCHTVASACAASLYTLGMAADLLDLEEADTVVVAGTDAITESSFGGFDRVQQPAPHTVRPFDRSRRGMLMGEGAVAVVLRRTGAHGGPARGRVRAVSMSCDATHPTAPDTGNVVRTIHEAHERAAVKPADIDLVIAHGTGTVRNDEMESQALHEVFGGHQGRPLVTSIKSAVGHTCGGSGLLSVVMALLALRHGVLPPIVGLDDPLPEADGIALVRGGPARGAFTSAQVDAFGMGGIDAVAVIDRGD